LRSTPASRWTLGSAGVGVAVLAILATLQLTRYQPPVEPLRIGTWHSPPYEVVYPDGSVGGLSNDVINEAARRAGIKLRWFNPIESPDVLLPAGKLDLWASLSASPDRKGRFFMTEPWSENLYGLASVPFHSSENPEQNRVGHLSTPVQTYIARTFVRSARLTPYPNRGKLFEALCRGEVHQAVIDQRTVLAVGFERPQGCRNYDLNFQLLPGAKLLVINECISR